MVPTKKKKNFKNLDNDFVDFTVRISASNFEDSNTENLPGMTNAPVLSSTSRKAQQAVSFLCSATVSTYNSAVINMTNTNFHI